MGNPWIEHVRRYAAANDMSYGCAISKASASYVRPSKAKTQTTVEQAATERASVVAYPTPQKAARKKLVKVRRLKKR